MLIDLTVFNETAYKTYTEILAENTNLFNAAVKNTISLRSASNMGDFSEGAFFAKVSGGMVKFRDAYATTGSNTTKQMSQLKERTVKVGAGTYTMDVSPAYFKWILVDQAVAGAAMGKQLAKDMMKNMLDACFGSTHAALAQVADVTYDGTAATMTHNALLSGVRKFGDAAENILCWIVPSKVYFDMLALNLANSAQLFSFGSVNVRQDFQGRPLIYTDNSTLVTVDGVSSGVDKYHSLGLTTEGSVIEQNDDFTENWSNLNGGINISRTYQAEWSYNVGVKGFAWDASNGGHSPNLASLTTSTNWDKIATSHKDLAGVVVETR